MTEEYKLGCEQARSDWETDTIELDEQFHTDDFCKGYTDTIKALSLRPIN